MQADVPLRRASRPQVGFHALSTWLLPICISFLVVACSTTGIHNTAALDAIDFGEPEELRICVLADNGISDDDATDLVGKVAEEFSQFGLKVTVPWIRPWDRPSFLMQGIVADVLQRPLEAPCDRLLALVSRNFGDFLWGLVGPEVLGAVDTPTHSRGFVVAKRSSLNQLINGPATTAIHETYHLMGCTHEARLVPCYKRIAELKQLARENREAGVDFFPTVSWTGNPLTHRLQVNTRLGEAIAAVASARHSHQPSLLATNPN